MKRRNVNELNRAGVNQMTVFGNWVPALLERIDRSDFDVKPIGPIGAFIKLRDKSWASVVEKIVGKLLRCFICHSDRDAKMLQRLMGELFNEMNIRGFKPDVHTSQFKGSVNLNLTNFYSLEFNICFVV